MVDLEGVTHYAGTLSDLPPLFTEIADAWALSGDVLRGDGWGCLRHRWRGRLWRAGPGLLTGVSRRLGEDVL